MSIESVMPSNHLILIIWLDYETIIGQVGGKPGLKWKPDHRGQQSFVRESTLHVGAGPYCSPFTVCQGQGDAVRFICYIMPLRVCVCARTRMSTCVCTHYSILAVNYFISKMRETHCVLHIPSVLQG